MAVQVKRFCCNFTSSNVRTMRWSVAYHSGMNAITPRGLPGAHVTKIAEYVNYQDGAVVSREIVKKPVLE